MNIDNEVWKMNAKDCILTRRSIRQFTPQPVEKSVLEEIVSLAAYAPSWKNTQITRYVAVQNPQLLQEIAKHCPDFNAAILSSCKTLIAQTFVKQRSGFERDGSYSTDRNDGWQYYDCGIAAQTFCLAAHSMGVGSVIMGVFDRAAIETLLQLPEQQELMALIAIGYPDQQPSAPKRKDLETLLSYR